jgi:hypothetical protein
MSHIEQYIREQAAFQEYLKDLKDETLLSKAAFTSVKICRAGEIAYKLKTNSYPNAEAIKSALLNWLITSESDKPAFEAVDKLLSEVTNILDAEGNDEDPVTNDGECSAEKKGMSDEMKQKLKEGREKYYAERRLAKAKLEEEKRQAIMKEVEKSMKNTQKGGSEPKSGNKEPAAAGTKTKSGKKEPVPNTNPVETAKPKPAKKEPTPETKPVETAKSKPAKKEPVPEAKSGNQEPVPETTHVEKAKPKAGKKEPAPDAKSSNQEPVPVAKPLETAKPKAGKKDPVPETTPVETAKPKAGKNESVPETTPVEMAKTKSGTKKLNEEAKTKKDAIPKILKDLCWYTWVGKTVASHTCLCCERMEIRMNSFECGHVLAEAKGGQLSVENLRPICGGCNRSMGSENLEDFKRRCGFGELVKSPCVVNENTATINPIAMDKVTDSAKSSPLSPSGGAIDKSSNVEQEPKTELPIAPPLHERRKTIALGIKNQVWDKQVGADFAKSKCQCCKHNPIEKTTFVCAHFKGESEGGALAVDNLRPICTTCDSDIGTQSINEFMRMYNIV